MTMQRVQGFVERYGILVVLLVAVVLRVAAMLQYGVTYDGNFIDAQAYLQSARDLLATGEFTIRGVPASSMPGFVLLLVPALFVFGATFAQYLALKLMMLALNLLAIWLVYRIGRRLGGRCVGLGAAALLALAPPSLYTGNLLLTENVFLPLVLAFTLLLFRFAEKQTWGRFAVLLAVFCAGVYVRETMVLLGIGALAYLVLKRMPVLRLAGYVGVTVLVVTLAVGPWLIRNYRIFGEAMPAASGGSPLFEGTFQTFHPYGTGAFEEADRLTEGVESWEEQTRILSEEARRRIARQWDEDPLGLVIRYAVMKPAAAWMLPFYWDEALGIDSWWEARIHALVSALGLASLVFVSLRSRTRAEYGFMLTMVAMMTVFVAIMLGLSRYVYPFMPFLYLAIAQAWVTLAARLRATRRAPGTTPSTLQPAGPE